MENRAKTIFCDIDGTLVIHGLPSDTSKPTYNMTPLDGTIEKLMEWDRKGYNIILTTGRKESQREQTIRQLSELGIVYDQLIMGIGGGVRVLINDAKPNGEQTAFAFCPERNIGIKNIEI